jgi:hypothetical protein
MAANTTPMATTSAAALATASTDRLERRATRVGSAP